MNYFAVFTAWYLSANPGCRGVCIYNRNEWEPCDVQRRWSCDNHFPGEDRVFSRPVNNSRSEVDTNYNDIRGGV